LLKSKNHQVVRNIPVELATQVPLALLATVTPLNFAG